MKTCITLENCPFTYEYLDFTDMDYNPLLTDRDALVESLPVIVRASENDKSLTMPAVVISYVINSLDKISEEMKKELKEENKKGGKA